VAGEACPAGASAPTPCDGTGHVGDYQDEAGQGACKTCPGGYTCGGNGSPTNVTRCRPAEWFESFYCPPGRRETSACPAGTYNYVDGSETADDCQPCPAGSFCPTSSDGTAKIETCPAGSWCPPGVYEAITCPVGYYCPEGVGIPVPCQAGAYCDVEGLSTPAGLCQEGYWCSYVNMRDAVAVGGDPYLR
jgi:hypothetical protein